MDQCRTVTQSTTTITARQSDSVSCLDRRISDGLTLLGGVGGGSGKPKTAGSLKKVNTVTHTNTQSPTFMYSRSGHSQKMEQVMYTTLQDKAFVVALSSGNVPPSAFSVPRSQRQVRKQEEDGAASNFAFLVICAL